MLNSLGYVLVTAAGTPRPITSNQPDPTKRIGAQSILLQALPGNAGIVYYGLPGMDKTTGVDVLGFIPKPASASTGPFGGGGVSLPVVPAGLNAAQIYIDVDTNNDGVVASYTQG